MAHKFSFCQTCETPLDCDFCDKLAALLEPGRMTLQELKAEAKARDTSSSRTKIRGSSAACVATTPTSG